MKKVAVIGAGIAGLATAYYLAKEGYQVSVFEAERYPAMKTSFANGGQISVSNSEVWTTWGNVKKGLKWMFTKDAPLLIPWRLDWAQWKWMAKFLFYTIRGDYHKNTAWTIRTGIASRQLYDEIRQEENINFDYSQCGILHFYKNQEYWNNAKSVKEIYNDNGCEWDLLMSDIHVKSVDPALADVTDVIGGAWTPSDATGDIHAFCYQLAEVLRTKYKVEFHYNTKISDLNAMTYDAVVVCNGVGSTALAKSVGDNLSVYPVKGYSITINDVDPAHLPRVSLLDDQAKIVTSSLGNRFRVAGTAELAGENYDIRRDRVQPLLDWVHTNFPNINTHNYTQWACLRPMTPNMMPIIEQSKNNPKIFYHTGHGHLGWTLSPATAKIVVDLVKETI
jgi:D-amino-acid dehydrogenase